jgi:hypothetical protein
VADDPGCAAPTHVALGHRAGGQAREQHDGRVGGVGVEEVQAGHDHPPVRPPPEPAPVDGLHDEGVAGFLQDDLPILQRHVRLPHDADRRHDRLALSIPEAHELVALLEQAIADPAPGAPRSALL